MDTFIFGSQLLSKRALKKIVQNIITQQKDD